MTAEEAKEDVNYFLDFEFRYVCTNKDHSKYNLMCKKELYMSSWIKYKDPRVSYLNN